MKRYDIDGDVDDYVCAFKFFVATMLLAIVAVVVLVVAA